MKTNRADPLARAWDKTIPGNFSGQLKLLFNSLKINRFFSSYSEIKKYKVQAQDFCSCQKFASKASG